MIWLFLKGAWAFLAKIPWQVWALLALAAAFFGYGEYRDHKATKRTEARVNAAWEKRQADAQKAFAVAMQKKREQVADLVVDGIAKSDAQERELRDERARHDATFAQLKARRTDYVTEAANRNCILTRGVVLHFNAGAARANGTADPSPAPAPPADLVDAPAGVSLDQYAGAVEATQDALGSCRSQVTGWQRYWHDVNAWQEKLGGILETCFPQQLAPIPNNEGVPAS